MRLNFILIVAFCSTTALAQYKDKSVNKYYPFYDNAKNLWGYSDSLGHVLIKPQFTEVEGFFQGFALVKTKSGWGLIDEKGTPVVKPAYALADQYSNGYVYFEIDEDQFKYMLIENGVLIRNPKNDTTTVPICGEDQIIETEVEPTHEFRRFFNTNYNRWELGDFYLRDSGTDSLLSSISFPFNFFTEPSYDYKHDINYSKYHDEKRSGMLVWHTFKTGYRVLEANYDSIWSADRFHSPSHQTFFGNKGNKISIINFDHSNDVFTESVDQFDQVKDWGQTFLVARIGDQWFEVIPSFEKQLLVTDVDDISLGESHEWYLYEKNGALGMVRVGAHNDRIKTAADYTSIKKRKYFFRHTGIHPDYYLFDVTLPDGKHGTITSRGVRLFR